MPALFPILNPNRKQHLCMIANRAYKIPNTHSTS